jgi:hypothetical protein
MAQINNLVKKISILANTGLYGSPKSPSFMNEVSKNYMNNVSSPVKAEAFAKFYKMHNKKKAKLTYIPMGKMGGACTLKKAIKEKKKETGQKVKKSPKKSPSPNYNTIAKSAAMAKKTYYSQKKMNSSLK